MKNWIGLLIAISLGIAAALLNWKYLDRKSQEIEFVSFLAVSKDVQLEVGDTFKENDFVRLDIPRKNAGRLSDSAVLFNDRLTVVSMKAIREYQGGEIVLRQDLKTPPPEFKLETGELAMWIPVNSASFVPSLVEPGDLVSFVVPNATTVFSDIDQQTEEQNEEPGPDYDPELDDLPPRRSTNLENVSTELVGPFRIISLGSRLGSYEVESAATGSHARENVMGIAVKQTGKLIDPQAQKLVRWMAQPNFRQASVVLHPRTANKK